MNHDFITYPFDIMFLQNAVCSRRVSRTTTATPIAGCGGRFFKIKSAFIVHPVLIFLV